MYHRQSSHQHFDLDQDNATLGFGGGGGVDPISWLSGEDHHRPSSPSHCRNLSSFSNSTTATPAGNVDRLLFNDLVQIVPLVQSLIDRKPNPSFTRRGSIIYTKTPSRESFSKKYALFNHQPVDIHQLCAEFEDLGSLHNSTSLAGFTCFLTEIEIWQRLAIEKGRTAAHSIPAKKRRDLGDKDQDEGADGFSMFSSSALLTEKDKEELGELREKVEDLQRRLLEKDEILKSVEASKNEMNSVYGMLDKVRKQASEKDALLKSTQAQLADTKIKLADKQAAVEKLQWEAMTSSRKVEKLQEDLDAIQGEMSSLTLLFEGLSKDNFTLADQVYDVTPFTSHLPDMDDMDELDVRRMEEAQEAYMAAVAAARKKQDEESILVAARARLHLQSLVIKQDQESS